MLRVHLAIHNKLTAPSVEIHPAYFIPLKLPRIGNRSVLQIGHHLLAIHHIHQGIVYTHQRAVIAILDIPIHTYNIHIVIARIPVLRVDRVRSSPYPDEIIQLMITGKTIVHDTIKPFGRLRPLGSPPEPAPLCFMQRTPDDRYTCVPKPRKLDCHFIQVLNQQLIFLCAWRDSQIRIKGCLSSKKLPPAHWRLPMPFHRNNSA
ncbi:hypothetical protein D3C73_913140 [compost metagenome]